MFRKILLMTVAATVVLIGPVSAETTVTLLSAERDEIVRPVISAFEAANPGIKVEHQSVPFDAMNAQVTAQIGSGDKGIDVYFADSPRVPALAHRKLLMDLEQLRAEVEGVANAPGVEAVSHAGRIYALPLWTSTQMMFYNKELLDKASIPYPSSDPAARMTYDQVVAAAKAAQAAGAEVGFMFEQIDRYYQLQPLFESIGGGSGLGGEGNLTPNITNEGWVKAATFYKSLFDEGIAPRGVDSSQTAPMFADGKVAFFISGPWQFERFNAAEKLKYGIAPVPYFAGGTPVTPTGSWAIGISPHTDVPEAAMALARFMTLSEEGATAAVQGQSIPPVHMKAYESYIARVEALHPEVGPAARKIITHELNQTAINRPRSIGYVAYEEVMNRAFGDIRNGADPAATLQSAQDQLVSVLARQ